MKVSVIIPTFNREYCISESIKSVLNQTYNDIEIIVIDDNSTDNTQKVIESINDNRLKYIKLDKNKGACFARNLGIELAKGEFIAFHDSDDIWHKEKIAKQLEYLLSNNLDVASCQIRIISEKGTAIFPIQTDVCEHSMYLQNLVSTQTIIGKKECFLKVKFDESLPRFQDWDITLELLKYFKIGILKQPLVDIYRQKNSISINPQKAVEALNIFLKKHSIDKKVKSHYIRLIGVYKLQYSNDSFSYFRKALLLNPFNLKNIMDFILSILKMKTYHYKLYVKKGRLS